MDQQFKQIQAVPGVRLKRKVDTMTKEELIQENLCLMNEIEALNQKFFSSQIEIEELKQQIAQKKQEKSFDNVIEELRKFTEDVKSNLNPSNVNILGEELTGDNVRLFPKSSILVPRERFIKARSNRAGTAFATEILTAVFAFDEIVGFTVGGQTKQQLNQVKLSSILGE